MGWLSSATVTSSSVLLGIVFTNWAVDHYVLWSPAPVEPNHFKAAVQYYHDVWLYPPYVAVVVGTIFALGAGASLISFSIGSMVDLLFDGACCLLYVATALIWMRDVDPGLRSLNTDANGGSAHLVDLKKVASGHLSICVSLTGILMLQTVKHFVVRSAAHDQPQTGASVSAVPAEDVAAPAPAIEEKPLYSSPARSTAIEKPATKPVSRSSNRQAKQAAQAALSVQQPVAIKEEPTKTEGVASNTSSSTRVTRSKSAALKRSDSETSDTASSVAKSPQSKKKRSTRSKKA